MPSQSSQLTVCYRQPGETATGGGSSNKWRSTSYKYIRLISSKAADGRSAPLQVPLQQEPIIIKIIMVLFIQVVNKELKQQPFEFLRCVAILFQMCIQCRTLSPIVLQVRMRSNGSVNAYTLVGFRACRSVSTETSGWLYRNPRLPHSLRNARLRPPV